MPTVGAWVVREEPERPQVTVVDPAAAALPHGQPASPRHRTGRRHRVLIGLGLGLAGVVLGVVHLSGAGSPGWSLGTVRVGTDGTLSVPLAVSGSPLRVTGIRLSDESLATTAPGALSDEVAAAQERGVPPVHDPARVLRPGTHTLLLGVRPRCPATPAPAGAAVLVDVVQDRRSGTAVRRLPPGLPDALPCRPLTLQAGLSLATPPGRVELVVLARAGDLGWSRTLRALAGPGLRVEGVGTVVTAALRRMGADQTVLFPADVTADCTTPLGSGLVAVFDDRQLPVPVTDAARRRLRALHEACR